MSLYQYEKDGDVDSLLELLNGSESTAVRRRAAKILGQLEDLDPEPRENLLDGLVDTANEDDDPEVRAAAIDALDRRGPDAVERFLDSSVDVPPGDEAADWVRAKSFVQALEQDPPELRMAAASVLGHIGEPKAIDPLSKCLEDGNPEVRERVAMALGRIGHVEAVASLSELSGDNSADVRREAAEALGSIGQPQCYEALVPFLDDGDATVRRVAANAMSRVGTVKPIDDVTPLLADDDEGVRRAAAFTLLSILSNAPTQRSHEIRNEIVDKLDADESGKVVALLAEIVEDANATTQRRNAAWVLGRVTGEDRVHRAVGALVDLLGADDEMTANIATTSLAAIGGDEVEDALLDVVDSGAPSEKRANAVFTLGKVGGERSRERLDALVDETEDEDVRQQAFSALSRLGGR
jgi:HEAT repeat protein